MKTNMKIIGAFLLGGIAAVGVAVYAIDPIYTDNVRYKKTNVEKTLDKLYDKVSSMDDYSYENMLGMVSDYDNDGSFTVQTAGLYKLEVWGAQGQNIGSYTGGYGGYSVGYARLNSGSQLFFTVGTTAGHNGGGGGHIGNTGTAGVNSVERAPGTGGTQEVGGTSGSTSYSSFTESGFGQGCQANSSYSQYMRVSGGGGYYGGGCGMHSGGGGGSGYINTSILTNAEMYYYNCVESSDPETKTTKAMVAEPDPTSNTPKKGNGHIRITFISLN